MAFHAARVEKVSGVYAILGPHGVYVGQSANCWNRGTFSLAVGLGLPCGIMRELPGASNLDRQREEAVVAKIFVARGLHVCSHFNGRSGRTWASNATTISRSRPPKPKVTQVHEENGRIIIQTTQRRASAILNVLAGSTLEEAGKELGISGERVRQYMRDAKLTTKDRKRVVTDSLLMAKWVARGRHHTDLAAHRQERIRALVAWLREFAGMHSRSPSYQELAQSVRPSISRNASAPYLLGYIGRDARGTGKTGRLHALYRLAGLKPWKPGTQPGSQQLTCRRGHQQWHVTRSGKRCCRECRRQTSRRAYQKSRLQRVPQQEAP